MEPTSFIMKINLYRFMSTMLGLKKFLFMQKVGEFKPAFQNYFKITILITFTMEEKLMEELFKYNLE